MIEKPCFCGGIMKIVTETIPGDPTYPEPVDYWQCWTCNVSMALDDKERIQLENMRQEAAGQRRLFN